jgi:hypothetical protein
MNFLEMAVFFKMAKTLCFLDFLVAKIWKHIDFLKIARFNLKF